MTESRKKQIEDEINTIFEVAQEMTEEEMEIDGEIEACGGQPIPRSWQKSTEVLNKRVNERLKEKLVDSAVREKRRNDIADNAFQREGNQWNISPELKAKLFYELFERERTIVKEINSITNAHREKEKFL